MKKAIISLLLCLSTITLLTGCKSKPNENNSETNSELMSEVVEFEEENPTIDEAMKTTSEEDLLDNYIESIKIKSYDLMTYSTNFDQPDEAIYNRENIFYKSTKDKSYYRVFKDSTYTYYFLDNGTWYKTQEPYIYEEDNNEYAVAENSKLELKTVNNNQYVGFDITEKEPDSEDSVQYTVLFSYDNGIFTFAGIVKDDNYKFYSFKNLDIIEIPNDVVDSEETTIEKFKSYLDEL